MLPPPNNLAARAGRWSAAHRKTAIFGWLAFVAISLVLGGMIGTKALDDDSGPGSSGRAERVLDDAFPQPASEQILVQARDHSTTAADPQFRAAVRDVVNRVRALPQTGEITSPLTKGNAEQISHDGRSALVLVDIRGPSDDAQDHIQPFVDTVAAAQKAHPELRIEQFGDASAGQAIDDRISEDFQKAETLSIPITLFILVVTFGSLVAAGLPLLLALTSVAATIGLVAIPSQIVPLDDAASSVILLIGMAVGVDYSLFYMRREREERERGADTKTALQIAAATSGRAVLVSGLTVMVAMAGMFFTGSGTFTGFAVATIVVVAVAMIGSITVLPALLAALGDRVYKGRIPFLHRLHRPGREPRLWGWLLDRVLKRPALSAAASLAILIALALPALGLHTVNPGAEGLPHDLPVMQTYERIQQAFPGGPTPAVVVIQGDAKDPAAVTAAEELRKRALASPDMGGPITQSVSDSGRVAVMQIPLAGNGTDARSDRALDELRNELIPQTVGAVPGTTVDVTGLTAGSRDFNTQMKSHAPIVFAFVLGVAFLLLLVTFRSIVIAIKAIVLNLLSVAAAYGVLVWIFQDGHLEKALDFQSNGGITSWLPLFLFVILFGLSMDYHVFILSRIREAFDSGMSTEDAISHGIRSTAAVVTSAAIVMVGVFSIFATLSMLEFKQMGIGLAVAVLLDATIIRGVLLPAVMKLLGDRNWYLPRWLEWLPRVGGETTAGRSAEEQRDLVAAG
jgi:RND superfamily putative drug exporter